MIRDAVLIVGGLLLVLALAMCGVAVSEPVELPPTPTPTPIPTPTVKIYKLREIKLRDYVLGQRSSIWFITTSGRIERKCVKNRRLQISYDVPDSEPMYIEVWAADSSLCPYGARIHLHKDFMFVQR